MFSILEYIWNAHGKALQFLISIPGIITTAIASFGSLIAACFGDLVDFSGVMGLINQLSTWLAALRAIDTSSSAGQFIIFVTGIDTLSSDAVLSVSITFGLTIILLFGALVAVMAVLVPALTIRAILKIISVCSAGFIKPVLFFALMLPFFAHSGVNVEWVNDNVVVVSGTGSGDHDETYVVITNVIGYCTNCVAATPSQMRDFKVRFDNLVDQILSANSDIESYARSINLMTQTRNNDVSRFFRSAYNGSSSSSGHVIDVTNHAFQVDCTQSSLVKQQIQRYGSYFDSRAATRTVVVGYNDGIYDYAHSQDPIFQNYEVYSQEILDDYLPESNYRATAIRALAGDLPEELCSDITYLPGSVPGSGGGSVTNVPGIGEEQLSAIIDYLSHLDDDAHKRFDQLTSISNSLDLAVKQSEAYYQVLSSALFQLGGTIVTDDSGNSWSNVYNQGSSELYDYNKSNVLQRIELLLYGISGLGDSSASADFDSADSEISSARSGFESAFDGVDAAAGDGKENIGKIRNSLDNFFSSASFLGSGSVGSQFTQSYSIRFGDQDFDVSGLELDSEKTSVLRSVGNIVRICFQVVWHLSAILLVFFYYKLFFSGVAKYLKWGTELLNSIFGGR